MMRHGNGERNLMSAVHGHGSCFLIKSSIIINGHAFYSFQSFCFSSLKMVELCTIIHQAQSMTAQAYSSFALIEQDWI